MSQADPDRVAFVPSEDDRRGDRQYIASLHPSNRFRLMFGQPLLPQPEYDQMTAAGRHLHDGNLSKKIQASYGQSLR